MTTMNATGGAEFGSEFLQAGERAESVNGAGPAKIVLTAVKIYEVGRFIVDWIL